jgi:hypothetical protein
MKKYSFVNLARKTEKDSLVSYDNWQRDVLAHNGNITIRAGRQCGKSEVVSEKGKILSLEHENTNTLVIAASQRQSSLLFEKIKGKIDIIHNDLIDKEIDNYRKKHKKDPNKDEMRNIKWNKGLYKENPTQTRIKLLNGSVIYCLPTGKTGAFIRGFTIDFLIADEAAFISEQVWLAIMPMIAVSQKMRGFGWIILLSTPFGKGGYFYNSCHNKDFKQIYITSEQCERISKKFLRKEKLRLSKQEYAQEYLAMFIDEFSQLFGTSLIKDRMNFITWSFERDYKKSNSYYLGVDIARFGGDENAFVIAEMQKNNQVRIIVIKTTERKSITDTVRKIQMLDDKFKFRKVFIDDGGVGGGATDLLQEKIGKRKVIGLNNSSKSTDKRARKGKILKEDLYSNALVLMESQKIDLLNDLDFMRSLKSVTFEYTKDRNLRIYGNYTHIAEAYVRACWCIKEKGLKVFLA